MSKLRIAAIVIFLALAGAKLVSYFQQRQTEPAAQLDTYGEKMTDEVRIARDALIQSGNMTAAEFDARLRAMKSTAAPADKAAPTGSAR
jgi:uncharacterized membrane protein